MLYIPSGDSYQSSKAAKLSREDLRYAEGIMGVLEVMYQRC